MAENNHQRLHAVVRGRVQGVNFRYSTKMNADAMGLTGWVWNLPNGSVELVAEGDPKVLKRLFDWLHEGPLDAFVQAVEPEWTAATGEFSDFKIRQ